MAGEQLTVRVIKSNKELKYFDYSKAVNWGIDLIGQ
jgi:hypothetical protein